MIYKELDKESLRRMQLLEVEMLCDFDRVCRSNHIKYFIFSGTLLGAVRHKGFIPWDDDIDVVMLREDYDLFRKHANELNSSICFFQDHTTDPFYFWGYGKLRRSNTKFIRKGQADLKFKTGIPIDIFPLDDYPNSLFSQLFKNFQWFVYRKALYSSVALKNEKNPVKKFFWRLVHFIKPNHILKKLDNQSKRKHATKNVRVLCMKSIGNLYHKSPLSCRYCMPREWFDKTALYEFENYLFSGPADYDSPLKNNYGPDYLIPPPLDKRVLNSDCEIYEF